jgi:antirestriction protein
MDKQKTENKINPSIYVGTYGKYNSGSIEGAWLKLRDYKTIDEFYAACKKLHSNEHDPELMFQDFEDIPRQFIGESHIDSIIFELIHWDNQSIDLKAFFDFLVNHLSYSVGQDFDIKELTDNFQTSYMGNYDTFKDYTYEYFENVGMKCCENFKENYFDFDSLEKDLLMDHTYTKLNNVFASY